MKIVIAVQPETRTVMSSVDMTDIRDIGEVSHVIVQLEMMRQKLLLKWALMQEAATRGSTGDSKPSDRSP